MAGDRVLGSISLERLPKNAFSEFDERLLSTIASNLGVALENARLFDETKRLLAQTEQRNAELAVVNEISAALAKKLDYDAIIDAVGDKLSEVLGSQDLTISILDEELGLFRVPYWTENGIRDRDIPPIEVGQGLTSRVLSTRNPVRTGSMVEAKKLGARISGDPDAGFQESYLGVPIPSGDRVIGVLALTKHPFNAFSEADEQLVSTIASSMGVALENARLFDETKRLLAETNERAAELAIINSVQRSLAAKLDMESMYELVGEKIAETIHVPTMTIVTYDPERGETTTRFQIERGVRDRQGQVREMSTFARYLVDHGEPILVNKDITGWLEERGLDVILTGEAPKSFVFAPLMLGGRVGGALSLQNVDREDAFTESDLRLVVTLASSLSVALENARLFDETQRLLTETDARAAELAIINSVQQGLAAKLDMQSMYDLVGDKILEIFDTQVVDIGLYDMAAGTVSYPYSIELGVRDPYQVAPIGPMAQAMIDKRSTLRVNDMGTWLAGGGKAAVYSGQPAKAAMFAPLLAGSELRGHVSLQNIDRTEAFTEADERLLTTLASSLAVALENARLFDETQRLLTETNERAAELQIINSVQQGLAEKLDMHAMYDLVGDKIREIFDAQVVAIIRYDHEKEMTYFEYAIERGVRFRDIEAPFSGISRYMIKNRAAVLMDDVEQWISETGVDVPLAAGEEPKSSLGVPLITGDHVFGAISLQNLDRTNAFTQADVRLLTTLAGGLSVALENARLFDETQRLLTETNERAAELRSSTASSKAWPRSSTMQSMYELVGQQDPGDFRRPGLWTSGSTIYDEGSIRFPYSDRARRPLSG